jgi:hypothetical protein
MEILYGLTGLLILISLWLFCGWLVVCSMNLVAMYLNGDKFFTYEEIPEIVHIYMGPLMFVFFLYPVWFLIKFFGSYLYNNLGRTVVVEDISKYSSNYRDGMSGCTKKASTKAVSNFFKSYLEKEESKFYLSNEADKNALENFFRIDGWRNVSEGVWTKIVKVSDLNVVG